MIDPTSKPHRIRAIEKEWQDEFAPLKLQFIPITELREHPIKALEAALGDISDPTVAVITLYQEPRFILSHPNLGILLEVRDVLRSDNRYTLAQPCPRCAYTPHHDDPLHSPISPLYIPLDHQP